MQVVHIAFLTLFLGLISGRVPVELAVTATGATGTTGAASDVSAVSDVSGAVANIEIRLDGRAVRGLSAPPWKAEVDLGKDLLPHHLTARALGAAGVEIARAEQWINLPQPQATVDVTPETDPGGRIVAARLSFRSDTHEEPVAVTATLDGSPLPVQPGRVVLPPYRADLPHLLTVEGRFKGNVAAHRDLAFGGGLEGEVTTDLTAVVLRTQRSLPGAPALAGWLTTSDAEVGDAGGPAAGAASAGGAAGTAGIPLTVSAVEEGAGEILVVFDPGTPEALKALGTRERESNEFRHLFPLQSELPIRENDRVRLVDAGARWFSGQGATSGIFGISPDLDGATRGLYGWLTQGLRTPPTGRQLADAIAVAGVQALADQRRRVVLLVLSGDPADTSHWNAAAARRYLSAIRVPLYVWSLRPPPYSPGVEAWGKVEDVSSFYQMRRAYRRLSRDLATQRIVWVHGRHLPQSIALTSRAPKGVELATQALP
jgi:hypothetical protein